MTVNAILLKHRVWLGFVLLAASWGSIFISPTGRDVVSIICCFFVLAGAVRLLADQVDGPAKPALEIVDQIQLGLMLMTLIAYAYLRFYVDADRQSLPEVFSLFALSNLPRPVRKADTNRTK